MATSWLKPLHIGKGRTVSTAIRDIIDYAENPDKTDNGRLITGYACDTRVADEQFVLSKRQYDYITGRDQGRRDVIAYHTRQSFKPGEITAEQANELGYELAMRFTKGKHAFVVCTHIDKAHIHNHIIFNSTALDCERKFRNFWGSSRALRRLNDLICAEHGLSVIQNPKPSREHYGDWLGKNKQPSFQQLMKQAIDAALEQKPADFDAFLKLLASSGIEAVRRGKFLRFRVLSDGTRPGQERFTRCDTLKGHYTEQAIRERIAGVRVVTSGGGNTTIEKPLKRVSLLIDIQARMQAGKGSGFERWAKLHNLKEMAKTLIFLQENGLDDYAVLAQKTNTASSVFHERTAKIKAAESRMAEISELQKHIGNYSRTREVYRQYKASGYSKKFRAEHEAAILLHQASKKAFDALGLQKLPSINALKQEYAALLSEKKSLYQNYRQDKETMRQLQIMKANVDRILRITPPAPGRDEPQR